METLLADLCRERGTGMDLLVEDDSGYWRGRIKEIKIERIIRFLLENTRSVRWDPSSRGWKEDSLTIASLAVPIGTKVLLHSRTPWFLLPVSGKVHLLNPGEEIPVFA